MKKITDKIKHFFSRLSIVDLLAWNIFFTVSLVLITTTVVIRLGVDSGFLFQGGNITVRGGMLMLYVVCLMSAISVVVVVRNIFIKPLRKIMEAMGELARGNFDTRIDSELEEYSSREIHEYAKSFNKAAEELSGIEILRKDFINNFSHEFKTPIVSINGFAELLMEAELPAEDQREYLAIIRDESRRLAELSNNILTLNRIESQGILRDREDFRLDEQIRQSVLVTEQKWADKNLDFQVDLEACEYNGNSSLLKEVWLNLLDNAAKFSSEGQVVSVTLYKKKGDIIASVTDQGPGMDEMTASHIFEQFYQGDTSHKTQGNGLGLAMVNKIVRLHEGSIEVDTAPGRGSCFTVVLRQENN